MPLRTQAPKSGRGREWLWITPLVLGLILLALLVAAPLADIEQPLGPLRLEAYTENRDMPEGLNYFGGFTDAQNVSWSGWRLRLGDWNWACWLRQK